MFSLCIYFYSADIIDYYTIMRTYYLKDLKVRRRFVTIHEGFQIDGYRNFTKSMHRGSTSVRFTILQEVLARLQAEFQEERREDDEY